MKIKKIEFQNFRNFKDHGTIFCSTDGKVTIVYGKNGDGKTTLHQLFQWIFYNKVHFNRTASDKMYNLEFEADQPYGQAFSVIGSIDFEHNGKSYSLRREWVYKKGLDDSKKISEDCTLSKKDDDYNWNRLNNPSEIIEELLPSGLAEYFFFDGESMIADLRVKGKESANKLRQALFTIFDLNVLERAVSHIGNTELKTTVLGQLYLSKATIGSDGNINIIKTNIENAQIRIGELEGLKIKCENELESKRLFIQSVSEEIGTRLSKKEYEKNRKYLKEQRDFFLKSANKEQMSFGDEVIATFPRLLISKTVTDAKKKINLKVEKAELMPGVNKTLIESLLNSEKCICGSELNEENRERLIKILNLLPPLSYKGLYDNFTKAANMWGKKYDRSKIEDYIKQVLEFREHASKCDHDIQKLDEEEKNSKDAEKLISDRENAEERCNELYEKISNLSVEINKYNLYLKKQMKDFDELTAKSDSNVLITEKIEIMEAVKKHFLKKLQDASITYSEKLKKEIQLLLNRMLTSKRNVTVSPDFFLRVYDSYDDESKSEGQFAIVSFAYIGGVLKLLKEEVSLTNKEYPLVLDGPFSKLDHDQRQNVIDTIPEFAPQVIIFSKDNLQEYFTKENIGHVWTISSNEEKNVARVEEGFLWK